MRAILFALFIVNVTSDAIKEGYKIKTTRGKVHLAETVTVPKKHKAEETNDYGSPSSPTKSSQVNPKKTKAKVRVEDNISRGNTWVPKKTKVKDNTSNENTWKDNTSKENTWVPKKTKDPESHMTGVNEVVEAEVLVLGAGMAGITVAQRLNEEGVEGVVVVEGSDRIGGRGKDVKFGGITIELGANWVHRLICQSSASWIRFLPTFINIQILWAHRIKQIALNIQISDHVELKRSLNIFFDVQISGDTSTKMIQFLDQGTTQLRIL